MDNYKSIDDLPVTLTATDMSKFLGISKCTAMQFLNAATSLLFTSVTVYWSPVTVLLNGLKNRQGVLNHEKS